MAGLLDFLRDPQFQDEAAKAYQVGLLDPSRRFFGQALGGATAGVLGAPVDLATLALNAGGAGLDPSGQFGGSASIWRGLNSIGALPPQGNSLHEIMAQATGPAMFNPNTIGIGLNALARGLRGIASATPKVVPSFQTESLSQKLYRGIDPSSTEFDKTVASLYPKGIGNSGEFWTMDKSVAEHYAKGGKPGNVGKVLEKYLPSDAKVLTLIDKDGSVNAEGLRIYNQLAKTRHTPDSLYHKVMENGISDIAPQLRAAGYDAVHSVDLDGIETLVLNPNILR